MKGNNLFSHPTSKLKGRPFSLRSPKNTILIDGFEQTDPAFAQKSAEDFAKSILLGDLYAELRPKESISKNNLIQL